MNNKEAKNILKEELKKFRSTSYTALRNRLGEIDSIEIKGQSGAKYQIEIQIIWDGDQDSNIRVIGSIDDGGLRAFFPLTESFIMAPDGSFVGE
jgi:hypothetical protein